MDTKFLDQKSNASKGIDDVAGDLFFYAQCFMGIGNTQMAEDLTILGKALMAHNDAFEEAFAFLFDLYIKSVQQGSMNMFNAAIAAANFMAHEEKPDGD